MIHISDFSLVSMITTKKNLEKMDHSDINQSKARGGSGLNVILYDMAVLFHPLPLLVLL